MTIGLALMICGLAAALTGFIFFRRPGVKLLFFGPVWRASQYVTPPGVILWAGGMTIGNLGVFLHFFLHI